MDFIRNLFGYRKLSKIDKYYTICTLPIKDTDGNESPPGIMLIKAHPQRKCLPVFKTTELAAEYQKTLGRLPTEIIQISNIPQDYFWGGITLENLLYALFDTKIIEKYKNGLLKDEKSYQKILYHI